LRLARELRAAGISSLAAVDSRSMKAQMRAANRADARLALILGDSELANGTVVCKNLASSEQVELQRSEAVDGVARQLQS